MTTKPIRAYVPQSFTVNDRRGEDDPEEETTEEADDNPHRVPAALRDMATVMGKPVEELVKLNTYYLEQEAKQISPPGALGLPPLLDEKRLRYRMIDDVFKRQPLFDYVYVWQLPETELDFGEEHILVPDEVKNRIAKSMPRGVIVAAGLGALDVLRSNCIELGHTVTFMRFSPWMLPIGVVGSTPVTLLPLKVSALRDSEELGAAFASGDVKVCFDEEEGLHYYDLGKRATTWWQRMKSRLLNFFSGVTSTRRKPIHADDDEDS